MFLCSGVSQWNLRSPVAFLSLSKIFAVYSGFVQRFLGKMKEENGRLSSCSRLFRPTRNMSFLAFSCGTPRRHGYNYSTNCEKTGEAAVRLEKGFRSPMGKRGRGKNVPGPSRLVILYGLAPSCLRRFVVSR